jgi:hypothetical protein
MKKRKLNGKYVWIVHDSEYLKYVPQASEDANDFEDDFDGLNPQCFGCVDRFSDDIGNNACPTFKTLGLERNAEGVCNQRILDENALAYFITKRMGAI